MKEDSDTAEEMLLARQAVELGIGLRLFCVGLQFV